MADNDDMKMRGLSLRYKLLAALTIIPLCGLSVFLWLAISTFSSDKIAYVFDSSLWVSKTRAARVNSEIGSVLSLSQAVVLTYRADTKNLAETGTYYFDRESKFLAFQIFALNSTGGYERTVDLSKQQVKAAVSENSAIFQSIVTKARDNAIVMEPSKLHPGTVLLAARFGEAADAQHVVAVTLIEASELAQVFAESGTDRSFLIRKSDAASIFGATAADLEVEAGWGPKQIWHELANRKTSEGISEMRTPNQTAYLVAFSDVGIADLVVVSLVNKSLALVALDKLMHRSELLFVAILALLTIIAAVASRGMTGALTRLSAATRKVAEGDFGVRVSLKDGGEIGLLANSFNTMAEEVSRLMMETAEKARMESELATAKAVQETLFPESRAQIGAVSIAGHYQPASECGGDWWYYFENGDYVYIWIGDATGHGAPAALLTSAARAVASVVNFGPALPVSQSISILNRAICEASKGKMMMTFFLACIDKRTGEMTYANASHEPPMILKKQDDLARREDFLPVMSVNSPRLGERIDSKFEEGRVFLAAGDRLVFYTDGVVDVKDHSDKVWGERRFLKSLASQFHAHEAVSESLSGVVTDIQSFREDQALDDDVTLIFVQYDPRKVGTDANPSEEAA